MTLPRRNNWPVLQPGMFALSVEFQHSPTVVLATLYDCETIARDEAKRMFEDTRSVQSIALLGCKADGKTGLLDVFAGHQWDSEADLASDDMD